MAAPVMRVTGLREFEIELDRALSRVLPEVSAVVGKGCGNIKTDWRRRWKGNKHAPALPYAIGYDVFVLPGRVVGEVGPDKGKRQGALGNLLEFGSVNNPPQPGGSPALDTEAPKFGAAMLALTARLLP